SRQRYWGEPIPVIHCLDCGTVAVPEKDLPVKLPKVKSYEPTGTGESPLANIKKWVEVKCPKCGKKARRETNTMPQWAGSCWYYAAYAVRGNPKFEILNSKLLNQWLPVDLYIGGVEHAVLHLLYARFWHKFLFDIGVVGTAEPFQKLMNQGLMMGPDGAKMSKSKGNVINPDEMIEKFGADALRMYEMFMGPFEDAKAWDPNGIVGIARFLNRFWNFVTTNKKTTETNEKALYPVHRTIKKVTEDIEKFRFNTAISAMMVLLNEIETLPVAKHELVPIVKILSPFAPHIAQELYSQLGSKKLLDNESWPEWDAKLAEEEIFDLVVQVNGRTRGKMKAVKGIAEHEAKELALDNADVKKWVVGDVKRVIFVKDRLINLIVG
ncbi:MAG: class I tRNA ligase family protein, partial [bacterium]|nr:class I tRNA ligase family protein [bacterium]